MLRHEIYKPDTFLYFAYGSNMFSFRIHMNNLSAEFVSTARLDNYRVDFIKYSKFWGGPTASLVPTANAHAWGVIWRLGIEHVATLDEQEGVERKIYYPKHEQVLTPYMGVFTCRVYIHRVNPFPRGDHDEIPVERWPSWTYKEVVILGAMEHKLPEYYIQGLETVKQNGEMGSLKMYNLLRKFVNEKSCVCDIPKKKEKPQIWMSEALKKKKMSEKKKLYLKNQRSYRN